MAGLLSSASGAWRQALTMTALGALLAACAESGGPGDDGATGGAVSGGAAPLGGGSGGTTAGAPASGGANGGSAGAAGSGVAGSIAQCSGDFPVACRERDGVPADCWGAGTDCSTIVSCEHGEAACEAGFSVDCSTDNCFSPSTKEALESSDAACSNARDDDGDGFVDCDDLACLTNPSVSVCGGENTNRACSGGADEDGDGVWDCGGADRVGGDLICYLSPAVTVCGATELTSTQCSNGIDEDGDGFLDCEDQSCLLSQFSGCTSKVGDICYTGDTCESGLCTGHVSAYAGVSAGTCTAPCTSSAECGTSSSGAENHCVSGHGEGSFCYPSCPATEDCPARFGESSSCAEVTDVHGAVVSVCVTERETGTRAFIAAECASGFTFGYCTAVCSRSADCGTNLYGRANHCSEGACLPGCATDADCLIYGEAVRCAPVADMAGSSVSACVVPVE